MWSWDDASRETVVFESRQVRVRAYRCRGAEFGPVRSCVSPWHSIMFVRSGGFRKRVRGRDVTADPNWVVFFNDGEEYELEAPSPFDDRVTELELRPDLLAQVTDGADGAQIPRPPATSRSAGPAARRSCRPDPARPRAGLLEPQPLHDVVPPRVRRDAVERYERYPQSRMTCTRSVTPIVPSRSMSAGQPSGARGHVPHAVITATRSCTSATRSPVTSPGGPSRRT